MAQSRKQTKQTKTELDFKYLKISFPKKQLSCKTKQLGSSQYPSILDTFLFTILTKERKQIHL